MTTTTHQQDPLQQKQQYLRTHINAEQYEDFYQFCQNKINNIDVHSWTMEYTRKLVEQYQEYVRNGGQNQEVNQHQRSYNDYQSANDNYNNNYNQNYEQNYGQNSNPSYNQNYNQNSSPNYGYNNNQKQEYNNDMDDCRSSRVVKSSAVDLLDQAFQTSSIAQSRFQSNRSQTQIQRTNSMNFQDFDFWTSTIPQQPQQNTRQKSMTTTNNMHTSTKITKNTHTPTYDPKYSIHNNNSRYSRNSMQLQPSSATSSYNMNVFGNIDSNEENKKKSPYMKKQNLDDPYMGMEINQNNYDNLGSSRGAQRGMHREKERQKIVVKEVKKYQDDVWGSYVYNNKKTSQMSNSRVSNNTNINNNNNIQVTPATTTANTKFIHQQIIFKQQIPCFKSTNRSQLSNPNLNIFIQDKYQIIKRSFLAPDYPMFTLKVVPLGIQCKRNYDDFLNLKKNLQKFFPGIHLAYLDDNSWFNGTDDDFIQKQKKMLQLFMRDLLRNREIRNSRVMQDFITLKDHKSIKRKFQKYQKMPELNGIEQLCLLNGKVNVTISTQQKNYLINLQRFINKLDDFYQRHRKLTDNLSKQYSQIMGTFNSLIKLMSDYQRQIKYFNSKVTTNQLKNLGNVYKILKQTYKEDLSSLKFQHDINIKKTVPFLKYQHENMLELKKILEIQAKMHKNYDKRVFSDKITQEQLQQGYNCEQSRLGKKGISQESKNIIVLKYQVGYYGHQCRVQGQRLFDQMGYKIVKRWQSTAQSYLDRYTKNIQYRKNLSKINAEKYLPVVQQINSY